MAIAVIDIITGAYNRSAANDPGRLASDAELIAHLDRIYARAWPLAARARPDLFSSTVALTLVGIPPSATLPVDLIAIVDIVNASGVPVWLVPLTDRWRTWQLGPCVYRQANHLLSRNAGSDPRTGDVLTCAILDAPHQLLNLTDYLDTRWPRRQSQLLVDMVAVYLSAKDTGRNAEEHAKLMSEMQASASAFAADFSLPPEAVSWMHGPVQRAAGAK